MVMFFLGTVARITLGGTLLGSALITAVGAGWAWRRRAISVPPSEADNSRLGWYGRLLIAALLLVLVLHVIVVAYWPFLAYDPLWVYAYNGKIFTLEQQIPAGSATIRS